MVMHKVGRRDGRPGTKIWEAMAYTYHVEVFDILDPAQRIRFDELINDKHVWVQQNNVSVHPMEKTGHIYVVVFYRKMTDAKQFPPEVQKTPRELLEEDLSRDRGADNVDED